MTDLTPAPQSRRERKALEGALRTGTTAPPVVVPMTEPVPAAFSVPVAPAPRVARVIPAAPHVTPRKKKKSFGARIFPAFALLFAGALLVGVSVPANAFIDPNVDAALDAPAAAALPAQSLEVDLSTEAATVDRGEFKTTSYAQLLQEKYGNVSYNYSVTTGAVRWPFPYSVPISSGYGERAAPCRGCSSVHHGIDFTPGAGAPIYAIASGTVSHTEVSDSGFGNEVTIDHVIKGKKVSSFYGHMAMNSSPLSTADKVEVGDLVGLVGATGVATGPHLHFEIWLDGAQTNPYVWLKANAVN